MPDRISRNVGRNVVEINFGEAFVTAVAVGLLFLGFDGASTYASCSEVTFGTKLNPGSFVNTYEFCKGGLWGYESINGKEKWRVNLGIAGYGIMYDSEFGWSVGKAKPIGNGR